MACRRPALALPVALGVALALGLALVLAACDQHRAATPAAAGPSPCVDGSQRCAAAQAAPGSRVLRRGHRIRHFRWIPKINRESGGADVGLEAEWEPTSERR